MKHDWSDWPHKWFGFWRRMNAAMEGSPVPSYRDFVDPDWNPHHGVLTYLSEAPIAFGGLIEPDPCEICQAGRFNLSLLYSDGTWIWPEKLRHDVEVHGVRLPDEFVLHMSSRGYRPPSRLEVPFEDLPRPGE